MFIFCFSKIAGEEDDVNLKRSNEEGGPWKKDNCKKLTLEQVKEQDADKIAKFLELPAAKVKSQPIV